MRLLMCLECKSMEELPDFSGPPEEDVLLKSLIEKHQFMPGYPHHGHLMNIPQETWDNEEHRDAIIKEAWKKAGYTGMEPEFYATQNTFQEEAAKCFSAHMRPQDGCIDWHDRSKRIGNSTLTDEEKKTAREHGLKSKNAVYLCDFCPVRANYVQKKRYEAAGLYD